MIPPFFQHYFYYATQSGAPGAPQLTLFVFCIKRLKADKKIPKRLPTAALPASGQRVKA